VQSAVLFPTAADGIRGEITLTRYPFEDVIAGRVSAPTAPTGPLAYLPVAELEHSALLDRLLEGMRAGDVNALVTPDHHLAMRVDGPGSPARFEFHDDTGSANALIAPFAGARDLTVLGRVTTEWYVFAEYIAVFDSATAGDSGRPRRLVAIHPVRDGKFEGTFGYGFDEPHRQSTHDAPVTRRIKNPRNTGGPARGADDNPADGHRLDDKVRTHPHARAERAVVDGGNTCFQPRRRVDASDPGRSIQLGVSTESVPPSTGLRSDDLTRQIARSGAARRSAERHP
jgi:hypothetical protein